MNFDQRNRVLNAQHEIATVLIELRNTPGYDGAGMTDLAEAHYHLDKALERTKEKE
jgi:hypothetical protein